MVLSYTHYILVSHSILSCLSLSFLSISLSLYHVLSLPFSFSHSLSCFISLPLSFSHSLMFYLSTPFSHSLSCFISLALYHALSIYPFLSLTLYILSVYSPFSDRVGLPLHNIHIPSPFTSIMDIFFVDLKFGHIHFYTL